MCTDKSPKAFVLSAGIQKLPITWLSVDNFDDRVLCYKPTSINHNIHGCFLCRYRATGWFWWISGLRAVAMWSSSSFTKTVVEWLVESETKTSGVTWQLANSTIVGSSVYSVESWDSQGLNCQMQVIAIWNITLDILLDESFMDMTAYQGLFFTTQCANSQ